MDINYTLNPVSEDEIIKLKNNLKFTFIEEYYWDLFRIGNRFFLGKWKFYPIKDVENLKKTAMNIETMNKDSEEYIIIAEDGDENYIAYFKDDSKLHFINDSIEFEEEPPLIYDSLEEVVKEFSYKSNNLREHEKRIEDIKRLLEENEYLYYLYNSEINEIAGSLSVEYFPSINFLFWTTEESASYHKYDIWESFEIRKMPVKNFYESTLKNLDEYGDVFSVDWITDAGEEFFPEELLGD